jgi:hypothetical protein
MERTNPAILVRRIPEIAGSQSNPGQDLLSQRLNSSNPPWTIHPACAEDSRFPKKPTLIPMRNVMSGNGSADAPHKLASKRRSHRPEGFRAGQRRACHQHHVRWLQDREQHSQAP